MIDSLIYIQIVLKFLKKRLVVLPTGCAPRATVGRHLPPWLLAASLELVRTRGI